MQNFSQRLTESLIRKGSRLIVDSAFEGGNFAASLQQDLVPMLKIAAVDTLGAAAVNELGEAYRTQGLDYALHKALHGALGCTIAEANDRIVEQDATSNACLSGATGAIVGEMIAEEVVAEFKHTLQSPQVLQRLRANDPETVKAF